MMPSIILVKPYKERKLPFYQGFGKIGQDIHATDHATLMHWSVVLTKMLQLND